MGFGNLDRRIDLQTGAETVTANGSRTVSWSSFQECWAGLDYGVGDEDYEADQLTASNIIQFKIRYLPGITEKMRLGYGDVDYITTPVAVSSVVLLDGSGDIRNKFAIGGKVTLNGGNQDGNEVTITEIGLEDGETYFVVSPITDKTFTSVTVHCSIIYDILHITEVDRQRYLIIKAEKKD